MTIFNTFRNSALLLLIFFVLSIPSIAATKTAGSSEPILSNYFVSPQSNATMMKIAEKFEVTKRINGGFEIVVPAHRSVELLQLEPNAKLLEYDMSAAIRQKLTANPNWRSDYHTFDDVEMHLRRLVFQNPRIAKLETYGVSQQGRPLYALKLSDNVDLDEAEPELILTAATHGDELITTEVLLNLLDELVNGYEVDSRLTAMVDYNEIYFIPVVNPDGFIIQSRYANGVDPNRAYPWPDNPDRDPVACVKNIISFFHSHDIKGSIDFHASGRMVMYPWAYTYSPVESFDEKIMADLTNDMGNTNGYADGQLSEVIYVAKGSSADYYYWKNKTVALAVEIGTSKIPSSSSIPKFTTENREMTWIFLEHFFQ